MPRNPPKSRELTPEEIELWRAVTASVRPRGRFRITPPQSMSAPQARPATSRQKSSPSFETASARPVGALSSIDRKTKRELHKGRLDIDARLDLHGCRLAEAHNRVFDFLHRSQREGARVVLIVTGKGGGAGGQRDPGEVGVLRRHTPLWLADPRLREVVSAFGEASQPHGGAGALYVRIRKGQRRQA